MLNSFWLSIFWIAAASLLGFAVSALFSAWLKLSRRVFLIPYVLLTSLFLYAFDRLIGLDFTALLVDNWIAGLMAGVLVSILLVRNVRSQPLSRQSNGGELILDLAWLGLAYGLVDALFLNVMPILTVWYGLADLSWSNTVWGQIIVGALGLTASLLVALTYHLGYKEFRNRKVGLVLIGNALITLAFILSGNPLGAIISHVVMHLAAVMQGAETTIQLPPHLSAQN